MRFIIVNCHPIASYPATQYLLRIGMRQWRASHVGNGHVIDMFFWAPNERAAKAGVRDAYPEATFSDEDPPIAHFLESDKRSTRCGIDAATRVMILTHDRDAVTCSFCRNGLAMPPLRIPTEERTTP